MTKKSIIAFTTLVILFACTTTSAATFTTGRGRRTFKINSFRPNPRLQLQSFLAGFGLDNQTSFNIVLSTPSDTEQPLNFIAPYFEGMDNPEAEFYLRGPLLDITAQYIPMHDLFVTPNALNAVQLGIRDIRGRSEDADGTPLETVNRTYLTAGLLSRSRWETHNIFSDFNFIADIANESWGLDTQVGYEYKLRENLRFRLSYKYMATTSGTANGANVGFRVHY